MASERLEQQLRFLLEIDKEKKIGRQTYLSDASRKENDAEHAWHLAIMAMLLDEYATEPVDKFRVMSMVLIHDLVEVYAGDTFAYDEAAKVDQARREREAADKLFALLPEDQGSYVRELWEEFEAFETPEARFAKALDRFQPAMLNDASEGRSWMEHGVSASNVEKLNETTPQGSQALYDKIIEFVDKNAAEGRLIEDREGR